MLDVPTTLSPSRVEAFLSCPLAFRFASIDRIPEPPGIHTSRGTLVHRALELLFTRPNPQRTAAEAYVALDEAIAEFRNDPDFTGLHLESDEAEQFFAEARDLVTSYLRMEDPATVRDIGLELRLEAPAGDLVLRGVIDRLELDEQGELVVTDYKTGRAPSIRHEQSRLTGVHFYSFLCEAVFGRRPAAVRLMYIKSGETIQATPSAQSVRYVTTRTTAVLRAVERACVVGEFQPRPGALCTNCAFQPWCPAFGGDPERAAIEAPIAFGLAVPA